MPVSSATKTPKQHATKHSLKHPTRCQRCDFRFGFCTKGDGSKRWRFFWLPLPTMMDSIPLPRTKRKCFIVLAYAAIFCTGFLLTKTSNQSIVDITSIEGAPSSILPRVNVGNSTSNNTGNSTAVVKNMAWKGDVYTEDGAEIHRTQMDLGHMLKGMEDTLEPCWRTCEQRNNHIIYNFMEWKAGLVDRFFIIERLINLAGYLCANIHIPKPHLMLGAWHNLDRPLSEKVPWGDFRDFTWAQTGKPALREIDNPYDYTSETWNLGDNEDGRDQPTLFLHTLFGNQSRQHLLQLEEFTNHMNDSSKEFFVWQITGEFWRLDLWDWSVAEAGEMLSSRPPSFPDGVPLWRKGCRYYASSIPKRVQAVADLVWAEVKSLADNSTAGIFHIRRGDMKHECDTELRQIRKYIDCSFAGSTALGNITVMISTDEEDTSYLDAVFAMLESYPHVKARSLDQLARRHSREYIKGSRAPRRFQNNFFVFTVMNVVRYQHASFSIEQRRWFACHKCQSLLEMKDVEWVGQKKTSAAPGENG